MKNYNESMEMYLETIYMLSESLNSVHAIDVALTLNYSKPSVSRAMKLLIEKDLITINEKQEIKLTSKGLSLAISIYEKHTILTKMLMNLGASEELAEENACRIEHVITDELFDVIKKNVK